MKINGFDITAPINKLHDIIRKTIEKFFFGGVSNRISSRVAYTSENVILFLLFYFVMIRTLYPWVGGFYQDGSGYKLDGIFCGLDNMIPFIPEMAIFYILLFYSSLILTIIYFCFINVRTGLALGWSINIISIISLLVYVFFPVSTYQYTHDLLTNKISGNIWAEMMYGYYSKDTSFNCFPSLHASVTTTISYFWYRYARINTSVIKVVIATTSIFIAIGVVLSTLFVRQHYIADEVAGILLALFISKVMIDGMWKTEDVKASGRMFL
jgi:membrane-associated phospholipid phosphatase